MDNKTKEAFKQLQAEIRTLQGYVESLRAAQAAGSLAAGKKRDKDAETDSGVPSARGADRGQPSVQTSAADAAVPDRDSVVRYVLAVSTNSDGAVTRLESAPRSAAELALVSDEQVATIGNALSAAPKVTVLRALLQSSQGNETAAVLAQRTGLSSGSLYYHLRDLAHAQLIESSARGQFSLTDRGVCALLLISSLALDAPCRSD